MIVLKVHFDQCIFLIAFSDFQYIGNDYAACMNYLDPDVRCPKKAAKLNHSLTCDFRFSLLTDATEGCNPAMFPAIPCPVTSLVLSFPGLQGRAPKFSPSIVSYS